MKYIKIEKPNRKTTLLILIPMSIPLFFVSFFTMRMKYREFVVYGERTTAILKDISILETAPTRGGGSAPIYCYKLRVPSKNNAILEDTDGNKKKYQQIMDNIGDTLSIKITSKYEAKILSYKNIEISSYFAFWYNLLIFMWIVIMLTIAIIPYCIIFKKKKK